MISNRFTFGTDSKFTGALDKATEFITREQLYDTELWALMEDQFGRDSDDCDNGWRGEFWGKMMRGGALVYAYSKDEKLYSILEQSVKNILSRQDELGRICTYSVEKEFTAWDLWCRKYVMLGLEYFLEICRSPELKEAVIAALSKHGDYIIDRIGEGKKDINQCCVCLYGLNSSSILEPFVKLYHLTGVQRYLDFGRYIIDRGGCSLGNIFELAYEKKLRPYEYPVTKAYEMMSCFEGLLEYYRATGEEKYLTTVENLVDMVADSEITLIGSAGSAGEFFNQSKAKQFGFNHHGMEQETCVTVTWMKLCFRLLLLTGNVKYADFLEISMHNAMLGTVNDHFSNANYGMIFDSYSPMVDQKRGTGMGGIRILNSFHIFGCCAAIGAAGMGIGELFPVLRSGDKAVINTYLPGTIDVPLADGEKLKATVDTLYPYDGKVVISVTRGSKVPTLLRVPGFSPKASLQVNGNEVPVSVGYNELALSAGDRVVLSLDCAPRAVLSTDIFPKAEKKVALMAGPIVLARDKRLSGLPKEIDAEAVVCRPTEKKLDCQLAFEVTDGKQTWQCIDYASAGKTWKNDSKITVWM